MVEANSGLLDLLARKMSYLNQAQTVRAENVANANTPGYKPLEVAPFTFDSALRDANISMSVTDARHIIPASLSGANQVAVHQKSKHSQDPFDIEQESANVAKTGAEYQLVTSIFHKMRSLFNLALKGSA